MGAINIHAWQQLRLSGCKLRLGGQRGAQQRVHPVQAVTGGILLESLECFVQERQGLIGAALLRARQRPLPALLDRA